MSQRTPPDLPERGPASDADAGERLRYNAHRVHEHIDRLYPCSPAAPDAWSPTHAIAALGPRVRARVAQRLHHALGDPVRHVVQAGGRRWRPGLVAETIDLLGGDSDYYGPLIAAAEIVHTGSLIVDDVQDASPLRRGVPSAHTVYGIATALTAGTNAYFSIDQAISQTMPDNPLLAGQLRELLLTTLRSAHAGQALDVQGHTEEMNDAVATGEADTVLELVRLTHRLKSGAPVALGMGMAALLCGADDHLFHRLSAFGEAVGTAYQITDDVADVRGVTHEGIVTKEIAEDTRNGKVTMPLAHAIALLPSKRLHRIWDIVCSPASNQQDISELRDTLVGCGALNTCKEEADDLLRRAWTDLEPALPCTPGSKALYETARHVVQDSRIA